MAVQIERLEPGVIYIRVTDEINLREIIDGANSAQAMALAAGDDRFITINHFDANARIPFDLASLKNLALDLDHLIGAVTIGAPTMTQIMLRIINRLTPLEVAEAKTLDHALVLARRILAGEPVR